MNAAQEEQPMSRQTIHTERAPQAIGTYSQAVRAGDTEIGRASCRERV